MELVESLGTPAVLAAGLTAVVKLLHWFVKKLLEQQDNQTKLIIESLGNLRDGQRATLEAIREMRKENRQ